MAILQSNPGAGYFARKTEIDAAVARVLESRWYILGAEVKAFESEFAAFLGARHAIGVASGTDALQVALRACEVGRGDLVFTVSHTAVATVTAIDLAGATPAYVDIDPDSYTMCPAALESAIQSASDGSGFRGVPRAVIVVHLYGQAAPMERICEIACRYNLRVIEDCAQSHGATRQGQQTGTIGDIAAFSFYPTKNLGALGDGGAVVTGDDALAERARLIREYGWKERYVSAIAGMNSRLDELQAAILRVNLAHLDNGNDRRRELANLYSELLEGAAVERPQVDSANRHVWHQYVIRVPGGGNRSRDALQFYLRERGIGSIVHYPVPVHLQPAYAAHASGALPETERAAREVLSLPLYPELEMDSVREVAAAIQAWSAQE